jgi:predicted dienelactone hydrolase
MGRRALKSVAVLAALGVLVVAGLFLSLWIEHRTEVTLPAPTGPFAVGRESFFWSDDTDRPAAEDEATDRRELVVWIWYPAEPGQMDATNDDYVPAPWRVACERHNGALLRLLSRDLALVHGHSLRGVAVSQKEPAYPVVIMRAGASAEVTNYSTLAEDLASHGYFVVGFDAPHRTRLVVLPDGRVVERSPQNDLDRFAGKQFDEASERLLAAWASDARFVLDRLERLNESDPSGKFSGRLDMTRVGIFGHSFGGAVAAKICHDDPRCKAGIDIDGNLPQSVVDEGVGKSFMFLLSDHGDLDSPENHGIAAAIRSVYQDLPSEGRQWVVIRGANHFTFSDDGAVLKSRFVRWALHLAGALKIDGRRQLDATAYCVRTFFDSCLKNLSPAGVTITSPEYPEIEDVK